MPIGLAMSLPSSAGAVPWGASAIATRMALRGGIHLLLQHPLVDGAHGPLRPAVDLAANSLGLAKGILARRAAVGAADGLGALGELVAAGLLAPLLGSVGVANGHSH